MGSERGAVSVQSFLKILFPNPADDGFVTLTDFKRSWPEDYDPTDDPEGKVKPEIHPIDMRLEDFSEPVGDRELYYCISRCRGLTPRARLPSRKQPAATYVIVCDDIGTKIEMEKFTTFGIVPTYALETSKGNFQLGFRLKDPVLPERASALIDALIAAGYTDKGAHSANRVVRVPGSLNRKPGRDNFRARLTTWKPENAWTFSELAGLFHVTPRDTHSLPKPARVLTAKADPVEDWIWAHEGELGGAAGPEVRGLIPLRCPQEELHTVVPDRGNDTSTSWLIAERSFKCLHEHCVGFRTAEYKAWILEQDPDAELGGVGVDQDALAVARRRLLEAHPGIRFPRMAVPDEEVLTGPQLAEKVSQAILEDLVKVGQVDQYWSRSGKTFKLRSAIDDEWTPKFAGTKLLERRTPTGRPGAPMSVSTWLRGNPDVQHADKLVHRLGEPEITDGDLNIAPPIPAIPVATGEPTPWLELIEFVCQGKGEIVDHLIDWMSLMVGDVTLKPGWHVAVWGGHGVGKDLIMAPLMHWFGQDLYRLVSPVQLTTQFNEFLTMRLLMLDELEMNTQGSITAHDVYNVLKPWTALGNPLLQINGKFEKKYMAHNLSGWYITSNSNKPLPLERGDRRFLVIEAPREPFDKDWYEGLVAWGESGGWDQVIAWLARQWKAMEMPIRRGLFGPAPMTEAKENLIESASEGLNGAVRLISAGQHGVVWPELMTMEDVVQALKLNPGQLLTDQQLKHLTQQRVAAALHAAGWVRLFKGERINSKGARVRLWCKSAKRAQLLETNAKPLEIYAIYTAGKARASVEKAAQENEA